MALSLPKNYPSIRPRNRSGNEVREQGEMSCARCAKGFHIACAGMMLEVRRYAKLCCTYIFLFLIN
jgi:hypothetical protein